MGTNKQESLLFNINNKIISYLRSFRLSFWFLISVFFLIGEWNSKQIFPPIQSIIALIALFGIFSSGSMINNVFDIKNDVFARKPIVKVFKYVSKNEMLIVSFIMSIISLILLYIFINKYVFLLGLLIVIIGLIYSTPPIRLKTKPPLDCIMNAAGGTIPFFMGWMVNSTTIAIEMVIYGLIIFLVILHTFFFFTTIDIESDKKMGIKTSCNILGRKKSLITGVLIFIICIIISIFYFGIYDFITISLLICLPIVFLTYIIKDNLGLVARIVGGRSTSIFAGSILIFLNYHSKNILPIFFFILWLLLTIIDIYRYDKIRKFTKINKTF